MNIWTVVLSLACVAVAVLPATGQDEGEETTVSNGDEYEYDDTTDPAAADTPAEDGTDVPATSPLPTRIMDSPREQSTPQPPKSTTSGERSTSPTPGSPVLKQTYKSQPSKRPGPGSTTENGEWVWQTKTSSPSDSTDPSDSSSSTDSSGSTDSDSSDDPESTDSSTDASTTPVGPMKLRLTTLTPNTLRKVISPSLVHMTTTEEPDTATDSEGDVYRLSLDIGNPRCGDPKYKYHFKKYTKTNMWSGMSDVDACCLRPDIQATQDINVMNATCCLTQGSLCDDGSMKCCKNAECKDTEKGEKRCDFKAGFWKTSQSLNQPFSGWMPAKTPTLCKDSRYMFYREATCGGKGVPPKGGCCAMQDTTEPQNVYKSCCLNTPYGCCFMNGFCRRWIPSSLVPYELRENDFQKELDPDTLQIIQRETKR